MLIPQLIPNTITHSARTAHGNPLKITLPKKIINSIYIFKHHTSTLPCLKNSHEGFTRAFIPTSNKKKLIQKPTTQSYTTEEKPINQVSSIEQDSFPRELNVFDKPQKTIIRKHWTKEEISKLLELVAIYGSCWVRIAAKLGNNRTACSCRLRFLYIQKVNASTKNRWTKTEEKKLYDIVYRHPNLFKNKKWAKIAELHGNGRSYFQVYTRLTSGHKLNNGSFKNDDSEDKFNRGRWAPSEQYRLICAMEKFGYLFLKKLMLFYDDKDIMTDLSFLQIYSLKTEPYLNKSSALYKETDYKKMKDRVRKLLKEDDPILKVDFHEPSKIKSDKITWNHISDLVGTRTGPQCRYRWRQLLIKNQEVFTIKQLPPSAEEIKKLENLVDRYGTQWNKLRHFIPYRTDYVLQDIYLDFILKKNQNPKVCKNDQRIVGTRVDSDSNLLSFIDTIPQKKHSKSAEIDETQISGLHKNWTKDEINTLISTYIESKDDWLLISQKVRTKTPKMCKNMHKKLTITWLSPL